MSAHRQIGRNEEACEATQGPKQLIDLGGSTVIPGLTDGNIHGIRAALTFGTKVTLDRRPDAEGGAGENSPRRERIQKPGSWIVVAGLGRGAV